MSSEARILIVEDEAVVAIDIKRQLERLGYEVAGTARSARAAVAKSRSLRPDLVLMDIQLGSGEDGIEAARRIRNRQELPVVFLTAYADPKTLDRAKTVSPYGYIVKPFDEQDLSTTIEVVLSRSRVELALKRSHENLLAILDAQRQGTVAVDSDGLVTFVSQPANRLLGTGSDLLVDRPWQQVLPLPAAALEQIEAMLGTSASERSKIPTELGGASDQACAVEIDVVDDPRPDAGFILFFYDVSDLRKLRQLLDHEVAFERIIGTGRAMQSVFQLIRDVAEVDSPVLIQGETGTGKELVARAIHARSARSAGPFLPVNCGGLSLELAASQFFGHRRGAFTGALADHRGFLEAADGGTLFLDEVGELPASIQPALLRVLEDGQITRVGETKSQQVDFRLIAATSRDLEREIELDRFRADLFYRLSVVRIALPPLRDRPEDLPILARTFLAEARAKTGKPVESLDAEAMSAVLRFDWPGNVRQLKNAVESAVIRAKNSRIRVADLPTRLRGTPSRASQPANEAELIRAALNEAAGNRRRAAGLLGMSRSTFYRRLRQYGIED